MNKNEFRIIERNTGRGKYFYAERKIHYWFFGWRVMWRNCNSDFDYDAPLISGQTLEQLERQLADMYQHPYAEVVKEFSA